MITIPTLAQYLLLWHKELPKLFFQEEKALFFTAAGIKNLYFLDNWHQKTSKLLFSHTFKNFCHKYLLASNTLFYSIPSESHYILQIGKRQQPSTPFHNFFIGPIKYFLWLFFNFLFSFHSSININRWSVEHSPLTIT